MSRIFLHIAVAGFKSNLRKVELGIAVGENAESTRVSLAPEQNAAVELLWPEGELLHVTALGVVEETPHKTRVLKRVIVGGSTGNPELETVDLGCCDIPFPPSLTQRRCRASWSLLA